jgi:hypothetical protein
MDCKKHRLDRWSLEEKKLKPMARQYRKKKKKFFFWGGEAMIDSVVKKEKKISAHG